MSDGAKVLDILCGTGYCLNKRSRKPRSKLCTEHLILEVVKALQSRGNYNVGVRDVQAAIDGAQGESASAIRKLVSAMVKLENKIIERLK